MPRFTNVTNAEKSRRVHIQLTKNTKAQLSVFLTSRQSVQNWRRISWLILQADRVRNLKKKTYFLNQITPLEFEHYCAYLLMCQGWQPQYVSKSESHEFDGGVDAVLVRNHTRIFVQCKKQNAPKMQLYSSDPQIINVQPADVGKLITAVERGPVGKHFPRRQNIYRYDYNYLYATLGFIAPETYAEWKEDGKTSGNNLVRLWSLGAFKKLPQVKEMAAEYAAKMFNRINPVRVAVVFVGLCLGFFAMQIALPFAGLIHALLLLAAMFGAATFWTQKNILALELTVTLLAAQVFFLGMLLM